MPLHVHASFREIKVHTAKCDLCNKHNTQTMYRCNDCQQQCCTPCWNHKGDNVHTLANASTSSRNAKVVPGLVPASEDVVPSAKRRKRQHIVYDNESGLSATSGNPEPSKDRVQREKQSKFILNQRKANTDTTVDDLTAANLSVSIAANPSTHAVPNLAGVSRPQKALSPSHQPPLQTSPTREIAVEKVEEIQVRELLAERADSDQALMSILQDMVAGQASRDDIRTYQRHNDEIRTLLESQEYNSASSRRKKHIGRWEANETHDHPGFEATITGYALQKQAENQRHAHSPQARSYGDSAASDDSLVTSTILQPKKSAIERNHWGPPISIVLLTSNH